MRTGEDPVKAGLIAPSLARPGGHITGVFARSVELSGKRLELLVEVVPGIKRTGPNGKTVGKELLPKVKRVAFIWDPTNPGMTLRFQRSTSRNANFRYHVALRRVQNANELASAFAAINKEHADALVVPAPITGRYEKQIADFAGKKRLPWTVMQ